MILYPASREYETPYNIANLEFLVLHSGFRERIEVTVSVTRTCRLEGAEGRRSVAELKCLSFIQLINLFVTRYSQGK
jgi:hypothetical protein